MKKPPLKTLIISSIIGVSFMSVSFGTSFALLTDSSETKINVSSGRYFVDTIQFGESDLVLSPTKTIELPTATQANEVHTITVKGVSLSNVNIKYHLWTNFGTNDDYELVMTSEAIAPGHTASTQVAGKYVTSWTSYTPTSDNVDLEKVTLTFTSKRAVSEKSTYTVIYETVQGNRITTDEII